MIKSVEIGILTSKSLSGKESGRAVLKILVDKAARYSPEKYNNYEPIRNPFDPYDIEGMLSHWERPFLWRRSRPKLLGRAWFSSPFAKNVRTNSSVFLSLKGKSGFDLSTVLTLLSEFDSCFGIVLACIHVVTDSDKADMDIFRLRFAPFQAGITTHDLRKGLPDFPWAMVLGLPYRRMFGEKILRMPAYEVNELSDPGGAVYVQLTEDLADVDKKRKEYLQKQEEVKQYLGVNAFQNLDGEPCQVPDFGF